MITGMLETLLECTELLLNQCSEDNPDDVLIIFDAATEVARRAPDEVPGAFSDVINRVLRKELLPDWSDEESMVGQLFRRQLRLLLEQHEGAFPGIDKALIVGEQNEHTAENDGVIRPRRKQGRGREKNELAGSVFGLQEARSRSESEA